MKKTISISLLFGFILLFSLFFACKKNDNSPDSQLNSTSFKNQIQKQIIGWIDSQKYTYPNASAFVDTIEQNSKWANMKITSIKNGEAFLAYIPVSYNSNSTGLEFVFTSNTNQIKLACLTEIIGTQKNQTLNEVDILKNTYEGKANNFTGTISAYTILNNFIIEESFKNGVYLNYKAISPQTNSQQKSTNSTSSIGLDACFDYYLVTFWSDGTTDREFLGTGCTCGITKNIGKESNLRVSTNSICGSGSSTSSGGSASIAFVSGPNPIPDVKKYIQCFTASGTNCSVSILVDQPVPGTTILTNNLGKPGHTFLVFTQTLPNGTVVTRNIGFYPSTMTSPLNTSSPGQLNDDSNHSYNN